MMDDGDDGVILDDSYDNDNSDDNDRVNDISLTLNYIILSHSLYYQLYYLLVLHSSHLLSRKLLMILLCIISMILCSNQFSLR